MWRKAIWKGHPMRLELTRVGLLVKLANHYTTRGSFLEENICWILYKSMGVFDVWLLLYIPYPGLYNETHIRSIYSAIRKKFLNLIKLSSEIYFGEEYHYTLRLVRWLHTFNLGLKNNKYGLQSVCCVAIYTNMTMCEIDM